MNTRILAAVGIAIVAAAGVLMARGTPDTPAPTAIAPKRADPPQARSVKPQRIARPEGMPAPSRGQKEARPRKTSEAMLAELGEAYERIHDPSSPENIFARQTSERVKGWIAIIEDPSFDEVPKEVRRELRAASKQGAGIAGQVARGELTIGEANEQLIGLNGAMRKAVNSLPDDQAQAITEAFGDDLAPPQNLFQPGDWNDAAWPAEAGAN